eukprot:1790610-Pleurochrysis_carterae.AAC.2
MGSARREARKASAVPSIRISKEHCSEEWNTTTLSGEHNHQACSVSICLNAQLHAAGIHVDGAEADKRPSLDHIQHSGAWKVFSFDDSFDAPTSVSRLRPSRAEAKVPIGLSNLLSFKALFQPDCSVVHAAKLDSQPAKDIDEGITQREDVWALSSDCESLLDAPKTYARFRRQRGKCTAQSGHIETLNERLRRAGECENAAMSPSEEFSAIRANARRRDQSVSPAPTEAVDFGDLSDVCDESWSADETGSCRNGAFSCAEQMGSGAHSSFDYFYDVEDEVDNDDDNDDGTDDVHDESNDDDNVAASSRSYNDDNFSHAMFTTDPTAAAHVAEAHLAFHLRTGHECTRHREHSAAQGEACERMDECVSEGPKIATRTNREDGERPETPAFPTHRSLPPKPPFEPARPPLDQCLMYQKASRISSTPPPRTSALVHSPTPTYAASVSAASVSAASANAASANAVSANAASVSAASATAASVSATSATATPPTGSAPTSACESACDLAWSMDEEERLRLVVAELGDADWDAVAARMRRTGAARAPADVQRRW